jgi:hypothetical protein
VELVAAAVAKQTKRPEEAVEAPQGPLADALHVAARGGPVETDASSADSQYRDLDIKRFLELSGFNSPKELVLE